MTDLRTAAQQALEALTPWMGGDASHTEQYAAYHALRAALAKPVQEPVAWMCSDPDLAEKGYSRFSSRCEGAWNIPVYTSPPQRPAEPVEPVAWSHINGTSDTKWHPPQRKPEPVALDWLHKWANQDDGEPETQWHEGYEAARRVVQIHLTTPPQRKPLTEEAIETAHIEIWRTLPSDFDHTSSGWIEQGIRYAERAHGIE